MAVHAVNLRAGEMAAPLGGAQGPEVQPASSPNAENLVLVERLKGGRGERARPA